MGKFLNHLLFATQLTALATHFPFTKGALRNATIDDQSGDSLTAIKPRYSPTKGGAWEGQECPGCGVRPDPSFAFNHTYMASTYRKGEGIAPVEFSFDFNGTALYVFLTLAHNCGKGVTTLTEANFTIDDGPATFFQHTPDMSRTDFEYQFPAFVREGLDDRTHTFRSTTSGPEYHIFINFDYAIYTYDDGASAKHVDTIIGCIIGGLSFFTLAYFAIRYYRLRRRTQGAPFSLYAYSGVRNSRSATDAPYVVATDSTGTPGSPPNPETPVFTGQWAPERQSLHALRVYRRVSADDSTGTHTAAQPGNIHNPAAQV